MWDGESFAAALTTPADEGRDFLVLSQGAWSCQRSVRWGKWLLIRTYHTGLKDFPEYMLFDIEADPHETMNLAASRSDVLGRRLAPHGRVDGRADVSRFARAIPSGA